MIVLSKRSNSNTSGRVDLNDQEGKVEKSKLDMFKRLKSAHQNGLEGLALFGGGVAACAATGVPVATMDYWAKVHIGARVVFNIVYAAPPVLEGLPRSLSWFVSIGSSIALWLAANSALSA